MSCLIDQWNRQRRGFSCQGHVKLSGVSGESGSAISVNGTIVSLWDEVNIESAIGNEVQVKAVIVNLAG